MTESILSCTVNPAQSPFDGIRHFDEKGNEFWMARELMKLLGYAKWERFNGVIQRADKAIELQGQDSQNHIIGTGKLGKAGKEVVDDYRLTRYACYLIAMSGDNSKPEIAQAQSYFALKTREAETIIPAQNDRIRELELLAEISRNEKDIAQLSDKIQGRQDYRITAHGLAVTLLLEGKSNAIIEVDREIETTIDPRSNSSYSGQSLTAVKDHLKKVSGAKFKTGADVERKLEQMGESGLTATRPVTIPHKYIPRENLDKAYKLLQQGDQQQLL
jgi:hypothetical protein